MIFKFLSSYGLSRTIYLSQFSEASIFPAMQRGDRCQGDQNDKNKEVDIQKNF